MENYSHNFSFNNEILMKIKNIKLASSRQCRNRAIYLPWLNEFLKIHAYYIVAKFSFAFLVISAPFPLKTVTFSHTSPSANKEQVLTTPVLQVFILETQI